MPQLPSGRKVAIDPAPLATLLGAARQAANIHKVMAIKTARDLYPYMAVIYFVSKVENDKQEAKELNYRSDSLPAPTDMVPKATGYCLSDWREFTSDWSEKDKVAMREFLEGRATALFDTGMAAVVKTQAELHEPSSFLTKALVGTWDAGVHPAQEEGWAESNLGGTQWDDYDVLAALGLLHWGLPSDPTFSSNWEVMARLKTFLGLCEPDSRT